MKNVKELVKGIDLMMEGLALVKGSIDMSAGDGMGVTGKADKEEDSKAGNVEQDEERRAELEEMSYNNLKALVSKLGGKAVGKKLDLINLIIELEGNAPNVDEEEKDEEVEKAGKTKKAKKVEDVEEEEEEEDLDDLVNECITQAELEEFELDELKDIAKEMSLDFKTKATKKQLIKLVLEYPEALEEAMDKLGYFEEEDGEDTDENALEVEDEEVEETEDEVEDEDAEEDEEVDEDEEDSLEDSLAELSVEELADICSDYDLSTKGKKQALIDRIIDAVDNGDINEDDLFAEEGEDDEEVEEVEEVDIEEVVDELELSDLKKVATELGIKVKKSDKKASLKKSIMAKEEEDIYDVLVDLGLVDEEDADEDEEDIEEVEAEEVEGEEEIEVSEEVVEAEDEVEKDIRAKYKKKKLKDSQIKKFLSKYYDGDPDCTDCKGCSKEEMLDCYIKIQRSLVDDDCEKHELSDYYERGEVSHCCGKVLDELENGNLCCPVCGEEYLVEE